MNAKGVERVIVTEFVFDKPDSDKTKYAYHQANRNCPADTDVSRGRRNGNEPCDRTADCSEDGGIAVEYPV